MFRCRDVHSSSGSSSQWSADSEQSHIRHRTCRSSVSWTTERRCCEDFTARCPRLSAHARRHGTHVDACTLACCCQRRMRAQPHRQTVLYADVLFQLHRLIADCFISVSQARTKTNAREGPVAPTSWVPRGSSPLNILWLMQYISCLLYTSPSPRD